VSLTGAGVRGLDHVGLTVPDLDQAVRFCCDVLGATELFRHGPYPASPDAPRQFGRPADSWVVGIAMLRFGAGNLELLQIESPSASTAPPRPDDAGGHHLAVYVDDLDTAVEAARRSGVEVFGEPMPLPGPEAGEGARFVFLRAPWGLVLELVSYPAGKAFEQYAGSPGLHDPRGLPLLGPG
jgi:catechol 2,3-dioxygenase-like lactoylglutathione lyase family enzyme